MSEVEFELRKLGDLIEIYNNKRVPLSAKQREGLEKIYPYYGAQGIVDYVDDYIFDGKYILIAEDGENLKSNNKSICTLATGKYWVNNHAHIIEGNDETNTDFLYYKLNSISFAPYITGSAQPKLNKENLLNIELYIPSREHQDKIAKVLTLLDQKIQTNNQINQELEAMAKTLYDYWFVQFDFPDQNGKPYKSSGGKMVYSPELKREIPEGWGVKKLNEVVDLISGYPFSSNDYVINGKYKLYTIKNVQDGYTVDKVDNYLDFLPINMSHECQLRRGDLIMSLTGNVGRIGMVYEDNVLLNQRVLKLKTINKTHKSFIYSFFRSDVTKAHLENISTGTSQKNLSPIDIGNMMIPFPSESLLSKFLDNLNMLESNFVENQQLTQLRDWLLPMLMNGQVKVE
ncbi:restriction endonuclease subunit S [Streptococcus mitis]|uniref:EcoKI restriction-modification system protein HsdS n=1 Tax=Streptococcus mitis TaxID=28037 RepID=A0A3R9KK16_STRMT|nr:restriction endonuclease subunit S [Streptococcus mitis]RSJ88960.1 EcoKI restriction-modification system protein HsdS [Streptococcus mitis]